VQTKSKKVPNLPKSAPRAPGPEPAATLAKERATTCIPATRARLSRTNFYKTVLGRFIDLGLVAEDLVYDKEARKAVRAYRAVVQPVGSRRPLAPSLMYLAHVISERWNAELQSQGEEELPLQSG
jgi:hypothetical protein